MIGAYGQDPSASVSAFQVSVGLAGTTNKTVKLPKNFTLLGAGPGYTCGPKKVVLSTTFLTSDRHRKTQALSKNDCKPSLLSHVNIKISLSEQFVCLCSDMERNLHIFAASGFQEPKLLHFLLIVLQRHHHSLSQMCLWLPA